MAWYRVLLLFIGLLAFAQPAAADDTLLPLTDDERQALDAIPEDPEPEKLASDGHFYVGNENRLVRFKNTIKDLGGIYVGVGAEQNYLFAGWQKPAVLILMDFDGVIPDLHEVYRAFFLTAADGAGLIDLWSIKAKDRAEEAIEAQCPENRKARALAAYRTARQKVYGRLTSLRAKFSAKKHKVATFLTNGAQYDYIVKLFKARRVRALRGDLTGDKAMQGISKAAQALDLPVRSIYLSNAEAYFRYDDNVRKNFIDLFADEGSLVLRTMYSDNDKEFAYSVQRTSHFKAWLERSSTHDLSDVVAGGTTNGPDDTVILGAPK